MKTIFTLAILEKKLRPADIPLLILHTCKITFDFYVKTEASYIFSCLISARLCALDRTAATTLCWAISPLYGSL